MKSALTAVLLLVCVTAAADDRVAFIGVALDKETRAADARLSEYLYQKAGVTFAREELEYERAIDRLVNWKREDGFFLARATPYVYVVSEMLGAEVEPLATYVSAATGRMTYHSYFVVPRKHFATQPTLLDVVRFLRERPQPARFVFHSRFSTSSFFVPLLFFRGHKMFDMPESTESLVALSSVRQEKASSSDLVGMVARGEADLAAVWDGTKNRFETTPEQQPIASQVWFVQLPTQIPNDLLVCSRSLPQEVKERLRTAIHALGENGIGIGDFKTWRTFREATDARIALADLRWLARERSNAATVDVTVRSGTPEAKAAPLLDAARQAIRLAGNEFVLFDPDFHEQADFRWVLEPIHDGAVALQSTITGSEEDRQTFRLSFRDSEDLTRRLVAVVGSRMHRIRYVWPFSGPNPIVIRDTSFRPEEGDVVRVQKITWLDPERNKFRAGPIFTSRITKPTYHTYGIDANQFAMISGGERLDPMSNVAYRVMVLRRADEPLLFRILTVVLVAAFALAGIAAIRDLFRGFTTRTSGIAPAAGS